MAMPLITGCPSCMSWQHKGSCVISVIIKKRKRRASSEFTVCLAQSEIQLVDRLQRLVQEQIVIILTDKNGRTFTYLPYFYTSGSSLSSESLGWVFFKTPIPGSASRLTNSEYLGDGTGTSWYLLEPQGILTHIVPWKYFEKLGRGRTNPCRIFHKEKWPACKESLSPRKCPSFNPPVSDFKLNCWESCLLGSFRQLGN